MLPNLLASIGSYDVAFVNALAEGAKNEITL
jgi:hypothetical protein